MDYLKLRKWLKFFEGQGVSADCAVQLLYVYVYPGYVTFDVPTFPKDRVDAE